MIKIINREDFKGSPKYIFIQKGSPVAYLQKKFFSWSHEVVSIFHVEIAHNRTVNPNDDGMYGTSVLTGAVLGGFLGALLASATEPIKWDIDFKIWLADGRYVKANVKDEHVVRLLEPHMNTSQWDLDDFNEMLELQRQTEYENALVEKRQAESDLMMQQEEQRKRNELNAARERDERWNNTIDSVLLSKIKNYITNFLSLSDFIDAYHWKHNILDFQSIESLRLH